MEAWIRIGDMSAGHPPHTPRAAMTGSLKVFADTIPVHRLGDSWIDHASYPHLPTPPFDVLATGSDKVFADGIAVGQINDLISCGDIAISGSSKVF